jgi:oligopeptidase B
MPQTVPVGATEQPWEVCVNIRGAMTIALALATMPLVVHAQAPQTVGAGEVAPPVARVIPKVDTLHGDIRVDEYHWMRFREDPAVIQYLQAENEYTSAMMRHTEPLQERLYNEILGRIQQTDLTVPERRGNYFYYSRMEEGKQYSIFARRRGSLDAPEEILLDQNVLAEGKPFLSVGTMVISPDHRLLAYSVDTTGYEDFILFVKDLRTGELLPDRLGPMYSVVWANDNRTLFYSTPDSAKRAHRVYRRVLGTPATADELVIEEPDVLFRLGLSRVRSGAFITITSSSFTSSEVHAIPTDRPASRPRLLHPRQPDMVYSVDHSGDWFYVVTNDDATNFRVMRAPVSRPARENWRPYLPHRDSVKVDFVQAFRNHLVVYEREGGLRRMRIDDLRSGTHHYVAFPEPVYTFSPASNPEFDTSVLRYSYTSLVTPSSVYDYHMNGRTRELRKQTAVLGGYDPAQYGTSRVFARARDGTMVPVSLVYRAPLELNGERPMLLYAYGSYGSSVDPTFSSARLSLLDRGVIYAIAHIRGGQEMGRHWYDQGKMLSKMNTFTDFIDVAEHLIMERYTSSERLGIQGGSAGGLLMGAVVNMRPELFRVVIADVPFVDVINTMLDASIPLTAGEWEQWGNPAVREHYEYMKRYSPYDNVERKAYPNMLVTTGLNDSRVAYWEPAKWVARLRTMKTDNHPLLLLTNLGAGHGGASGRYDSLRELAFRYAFMLDGLGLNEPAAP